MWDSMAKRLEFGVDSQNQSSQGQVRKRKTFLKPKLFFHSKSNITGKILNPTIVDREIIQNPLKYKNYLGNHVSQGTFVYISDTHDCSFKDPSIGRTLDTRAYELYYFVFQEIPAIFKRRVLSRKARTWLEDVGEPRFLEALQGWPAGIAQVLSVHPELLLGPVSFTLGGDLGIRGQCMSQYAYAIKHNQSVVDQSLHQFTTLQRQYRVGISPKVSKIIPGNHDKSLEDWDDESTLDQAIWFDRALGILPQQQAISPAVIDYSYPACYLQEFYRLGEHKPIKAVLEIDTELLNRKWVNGVFEAADRALHTISTMTKQGFGKREMLFTNGEMLNHLFQLCHGKYSKQCDLWRLYNYVMYSLLIKKHQEKQNHLISYAQSLDLIEIFVVGHRPRETFDVATNFRAPYVSVIAGHIHIGGNSENPDKIQNLFLPRKKTIDRNPIRTLITRSSTIGAGAVQFKNDELSFIFQVDANSPEKSLVYGIEPLRILRHASKVGDSA